MKQLISFRRSAHISTNYPIAVAVEDLAAETGLPPPEIMRQIRAGLRVVRSVATDVTGCFCHPCQRPGGCHGDEFLGRMRAAAELSSAGYICGLRQITDGLEALMTSCGPWHRHHALDGYRRGEIVRRWSSGDRVNACRMMVRP